MLKIKSKTDDQNKLIEFIQYDIPPLRPDIYALDVKQNIPDQDPGSFEAKKTFVVQGDRFTFAAKDLNSVFPPQNANGEFDGVLPHVIFNKRTFPWERLIKEGDKTYDSYPWIAVLLFNEGEQPKIEKKQVQDLFPLNTDITCLDGSSCGKGSLPDQFLSYPVATLNPLGYDENPQMEVQTIDIPLGVFNKVTPCLDDMQYLAHVRQVDLTDAQDSDQSTQQNSVVVAGRIPPVNITSYAYLVSLEDFADYLPDTNGTQSNNIGNNINTIRLICYHNWSFTANDLDQNLQKLLENLNKINSQLGPTTLKLPSDQPTSAQVNDALSGQAAGSLTDEQSTVLIQNMLNMGYIPFNHHMRHGGNTVSAYRGPLAPYFIEQELVVPASGPDSVNRYNPETGLFDVSYGVAWQLGQLMMLQNKGVANDLYEWKRVIKQEESIQAEQNLINSLFTNGSTFESFFSARKENLRDNSVALPENVASWFSSVFRLKGIPFNYLVPDERLLPQESLRFFYYDLNWIEALMDGAFSIGSSVVMQQNTQERLSHVSYKNQIFDKIRQHRKNNKLAKFKLENNQKMYTGFLMRSQANVGWPDLHIKGYADTEGDSEIQKLTYYRLSKEVIFCLFDGVIKMISIAESPIQLHMGVEGENASYFTTLRRSSPPDAGKQYLDDPSKKVQPCTGKVEPIACVTTRADKQTLQIAQAAKTINDRLVTDFNQTFPKGFTSAEFALQMTKGVLMVYYENAK